MAELGSDYAIANGNLPIQNLSSLSPLYATGGGVVQTIYTHYTTTATQAMTANANNRVNNAGLGGISITTKPASPATGASNVVLIYARWSGEINNLWNVMWGLERDGTYLTDPFNSPGSRNIGVLPGGDSYATTAENNGSTPAMVDFWWLDVPPANATSTYYITCRPAAASTLYINRTVTDSNADGFERMTSGMMVWEIAR